MKTIQLEDLTDQLEDGLHCTREPIRLKIEHHLVMQGWFYHGKFLSFDNWAELSEISPEDKMILEIQYAKLIEEDREKRIKLF